MLDYNEIGKQIKIERIKKDITQEQLAEMSEISISHLSSIERGATKLGLRALVEIANSLNVSADILLSRSLTNTSSKNILLSDISELLDGCSTYEMIFIEELVRNARASLKKLKRSLVEDSKDNYISKNKGSLEPQAVGNHANENIISLNG